MHKILSADFKAEERSMKRWQEICNYLYLITEMRKFQQNCPITIADIGMKPFDNILEAKRMINTINVKKFKLQNTISNFSFSTREPLTPLKRQRLHDLINASEFKTEAFFFAVLFAYTFNLILIQI